MCRQTTCKTCGKADWAGCGQHVDTVMAGIPKNARCTCRTDGTRAREAAAAPKGFFARLLGR